MRGPRGGAGGGARVVKSLAQRILESEPVALAREFLFPSRVRRRAIPPLDGGFAPNDRLERSSVVAEIPAPDDLLPRADGSLVVSSGQKILRLSGAELSQHDEIAELSGEVTALAETADGTILAGIAGVGVARVASDGSHGVLAALDCPTSIAVAADGALLITDGSRAHRPADWVWDLMEERREGRLLRLAPGGGEAEVIADGLAWPAGVAIDPTNGSIAVTQAWEHRVDRIDAGDRRLKPLAANLPGYPARVVFAPDGSLWLSLFAMRTHLVELVLGEDEFKDEMMRTIHPDYWIRPDLRTIDSGLIPLQGGGIRKLGITKPWAPPRSYGLVCRLDAEGLPLSSLHSRPGGRNHGITSVRVAGDDLWIASKGGNRVLRHRVEDAA